MGTHNLDALIFYSAATAAAFGGGLALLVGAALELVGVLPRE